LVDSTKEVLPYLIIW